VLTEIAKGTDAAAMAALRTLNIDMTFRALRALPMRPTGTSPSFTRSAGAPQRTVSTADNDETLPGTIIRSEGQTATGDLSADEAYDGLGATLPSMSSATSSRTASPKMKGRFITSFNRGRSTSHCPMFLAVW